MPLSYLIRIFPNPPSKTGLLLQMLLLLQLEFVFELLENKTFHRQLLPLIEAEGGSDTLQSFFLELSEQV